MAKRKPVLSDTQVKSVYDSMTELKQLLAQMDQFEACGQDCQQFRSLAHAYFDQLSNIEKYVIKGQPVPQPTGSE